MNLTTINETYKKQTSVFYKIFKTLFAIDFFQFVPMIFLLTLGLMYIYSTGHQFAGNPYLWERQLRYIFLGFLGWSFLAYVDYRVWKHWALIIYISGITALVLVLFLGTLRYGARRWFSLFGVLSVQPSEFAKLATLIMLAWLLSLRNFTVHNFLHLSAFIATSALPFLLIYLEPDLGSALIIIPISAVMLFVAGIKWKWIIVAFLIVAISIPVVYPFLHGYQKERILVFLDPSRDPTNKGWNSRQSQLAVASGKLTGKGYGNSTQSSLGFLPKTVSNSDFIFSVIAEETGFIGACVVLFAYLLLIISAFRAAVIAVDNFGKYMAMGIGIFIFIHSAVNIGMTIRLMPVTGLPLPLVSLGGSFVVMTMLSLGLVQSIYIQAKKHNNKDCTKN